MPEPKTAADSQFRLSTDSPAKMLNDTCLLYTSDAADEL